MSLHYLPQQGKNLVSAHLAVPTEAVYLQGIHRILFLERIYKVWMRQLPNQDDLNEKVDTFFTRFARLKDRICSRQVPGFSAQLGEVPKSMIDMLAQTEKIQWVNSTGNIIGARKLRNLFVHGYI